MITNEASVEPQLQLDRWSLLSRTLHERALSHIVEAFRSVDIEAIAIKGWSIERFYPDHVIRPYSDVDLAVRPDQFDSAREVAARMRGLSVGVDLHEGLRDRDTLGWEELFDRSYTVPLYDVPVRVLSEEDNLRITAAHWLIDGGVYKSRLYDIYYLVRHRKPDFNWERCLEAAGPIRRTWVLTAIATARDRLNLDVSELPREAREFKLPAWYLEALDREWSLGPYLRIPIWQCLGRPKTLVEQVRRRFPPNPIAATTDTEGAIDESSRRKFQIKSVLKKIRPAAMGMYGRFVTRPKSR